MTAPLFPSWVVSRRPFPPTCHASQPRRAVSDPRREAPFSKVQLLIKSRMQDCPSAAPSVLHMSRGVHARWSVLEHRFNCSGRQTQRATVAGGGRSGQKGPRDKDMDTDVQSSLASNQKHKSRHTCCRHGCSGDAGGGRS